MIGLDLDNITKEQAIQKARQIEKEQKAPVILYQTKHGFHIEILKDVTVEENFEIRKKYGDDPKRLEISKKRYKITGKGHDILFAQKNGYWRKRIWY